MEQAWIGMAEVESIAGEDVLDGDVGAIVNILGLARTAAEFEFLAEAELLNDKMKLLSISDVELISTRKATGHIAPKLLTLAGQLSREFPVLYDEFQTYDSK